MRITAVDDDVDAPHKRLQVGATVAGGNGVAAPASLELTIADDEPTPVATLVLSAGDIPENGGSATVTATLTGPSSQPTTLAVTATPFDPATGDYFTQAGTALTIATGRTESTGAVTIAARDDDEDGADKTVQVAATAFNSHGVAEPAAEFLRILDNEAIPAMSFELSREEIDEDGGTSTVTAVLDHPSEADTEVTISVSIPDRPAGGGANLRSVQAPRRSRSTKSVRSPPPPPPPPYHLDGDLVQTILAGQTRAQPVEITWVDDEVDGPDTTVTFAATVENDLRVRPPRSAQIKVNDDDDTPAVTLHLAPDAIAEDGGATVVTATLDRLSSADTTVRVSAAPVAPAQAGDFAVSGDTVLTIAAQADTSSGTLTITALDNDVDAAPKTVTVSGKASNDQGAIDPADVTLTIEDDDHSPVFGAATPRAVAENTAAGTDVGAPVAATDQDAGDTLSYRLLGTDAAVFDVVAATGQLRTEAALDYEARDAYTVTVEADDGNGNRGDVTVTIDVTDVDEPPGKPAVPTVTAASVTSLRVTWTAPANTGPPITDYDYRYKEHGTPDWTEVTGTTLTVTTVTIASLSENTEYDVSVRATNDEGTGLWSEPGEGATDANAAPEFTAASAEFEVDENETAVGTVQASDSDAEDSVSGYTLSGGVDQGLFELNATSGALSFKAAPNHEQPLDVASTDPVNAAGNNQYVLEVSATSGSGEREKTTPRTVVVEVTNVAEAPGKPDAPVVTALSPVRLEVTWTAPANAGPAIEDYDYRYRTDVPEGSWTEVTGTTLTLQTAEIASLSENTEYDVSVRATNDEGTGLWSEPGEGATDANAAPEFTEASAEFRVAENQTEVGTVQASDSDAEDSVTGYTLSGGVDQGLFELDEMTGALTFKAAPNHEEPLDVESTAPANDAGNNEYVLEVSATSGSGEREKTTSRTVVVTVTDEPELPAKPAVPTVTAVSVTSLRVTWTAPANAGPEIEDYDYRYRTDDPEGSWTEVVDTALTVLTAEIGGLSENTAYDVSVRAKNDEGTGEWSEPGTGTTDANAAPEFTPASAEFRVAENQTEVGTVQASDSDAEDSVSGYALSGGVDQALFELDEMTGALTFKAAPNHEEPLDLASTTPANAAGDNEYVLEVSATSGSGERQKTTPQTVVVEVTDVNEAPGAPARPTVVVASVTSLRVTWTAPENMGPAITDYDYRYRTDDPEGSWTDVVDTTLTVLTASIGSLSENTAYDVSVRATNDEGTGQWSEPGTGTTDANAAPEFTEASAEFRVAENQTEVGTVQASDSDAEDSVSGYTLSGGVDQGLFELDEMTGALTFKAAPNHEEPLDVESTTPANAAGDNQYVLEVSATSGSGERAKTTPQTVVVTVTNEPEPPAAPDMPDVTPVSTDSLMVTWTEPANTGPPIEDYDYRYRRQMPRQSAQAETRGRRLAASTEMEAPQDDWKEVMDTSITVLEVMLYDLLEDTAYQVQVRAKSAEGSGAWSPAQHGRTKAAASTAPVFTGPAHVHGGGERDRGGHGGGGGRR